MRRSKSLTSPMALHHPRSKSACRHPGRHDRSARTGIEPSRRLAPNLVQRLTLGTASARGRAVIYIFLSGGLAQQDSFDLKPDAPEDIRGEFKPIATSTPGISICEHLPMLASRSQHWSLLRSLTHPSNDHSAGHLIMLTGRSQLPRGSTPPSRRQPTGHRWPPSLER